jgi:Cysteine-rich secretory protein family
MNGTKRITATALIVVSLAASCLAQDQPKKSWVWLTKQGVWGYGYQIDEGPNRGLWRIDPETKRAPEEMVPTTDPYGFAAILNQYRAAAGLAPMVYDHELSAWAAQNNVVQSEKGIGHHITANCFQNCAWNTPDAASTAEEWMNSRGHRANMLTPAGSRFGIAYGPGPYWTMNAR